MPDGQVLEFTRVTKRFNDVTAVSDFSARVEPGIVTAFVGPNGAGKTTTLRILLGQVRQTSGTATIGGVPFSELRSPLRTIGSVLEETVYRPRRTAARQLTTAAKANGIPLSRVDEVLALVGLDGEREGRIGSFSLGMRQRLSVAHALLGDAGTLVFDEPANGLDPEGIRWMRLLMRRLADEGRTVLVSSHVLSEVEQVADHVLVLSKGRLVLSSGIESLADPASGSVVVDAADRAALTAALAAAGFEVEVLRSGLTVRGGDATTVGSVAAAAGIALSTLVQRGPTLEDVFIDLVRGGRFEPQATAQLAPPVVPAIEVPAADAAGADVPEQVADAAAEVAPSAAESAGTIATLAAESLPDAPPAVPASSEAAEAATAEDEPAEDEARATAEDGSATSAPTFDDILFGTAGVEADSAEEDAHESADSDDELHAGVEVFEGFGASVNDGDSNDDAVADHAAGEDHVGDHEAEEEQSDGEGGQDEGADGDPRSAAVTSMLAAAARAYYEDEPPSYPLGEETPAADEEQPQQSEDTHWSVASTGVIDTVPAPVQDEERTEHADTDGQERDGEQSHEDEQGQGHQGAGDEDHAGSQRDGAEEGEHGHEGYVDEEHHDGGQGEQGHADGSGQHSEGDEHEHHDEHGHDEQGEDHEHHHDGEHHDHGDEHHHG